MYFPFVVIFHNEQREKFDYLSADVSFCLKLAAFTWMLELIKKVDLNSSFIGCGFRSLFHFDLNFDLSMFSGRRPQHRPINGQRQVGRKKEFGHFRTLVRDLVTAAHFCFLFHIPHLFRLEWDASSRDYKGLWSKAPPILAVFFLTAVSDRAQVFEMPI